jgi:hypothetical protein
VCWPTLTKIFSSFDTRDLDKSQPQMNCGTHIITGGTGKCKGITGMRRSRTRHLGDDADRLRGDWFRDLFAGRRGTRRLSEPPDCGWRRSGLVSDEPKHPPGPPMTLGNMRELGVQRLIASCLLCLSR